jgi:hypothetical protein
MLSPVCAASSVSVGVELLGEPEQPEERRHDRSPPLLVSFLQDIYAFGGRVASNKFAQLDSERAGLVAMKRRPTSGGVFHQLTQSSTARPKTL